MTKVILFGTHPKQFNGYSKVVYELMKGMSNFEDIELVVFGFQNFYHNPNHRPDIPKNIEVYDAFSHENPKALGFGTSLIQDFVKEQNPDVCIVFNDMMVVAQTVTELKKIPDAKFKIIGYIDQVYLNQKKMFIEFINKNIDVSVLFTPHWENNIKEQGVTTPTFHLQHGFNKNHFFPIPKHIARQYFNIDMKDFVILNLNRNQPRKRWDICLKAFAEIVSRYPNEPIKLMIGTAIQGSWNLIEIFERELKKRGLTIQDGIKHLIVMDNPQKISDEETNILYNVADIGINTCDGEGFGLCNFEQAGVGIPQIVTRLGGFLDFFNEDNSILLNPKMSYYVDSTRDIVSGEALLCSYVDLVDGIETYYLDRKKMEEHGQNARQKILKDYTWESISQKLRDIIISTVPLSKSTEQHKIEVSKMINEVEEIDLQTLEKLKDMKKDTNEIKETKDSQDDKNVSISLKELRDMQNKIAQLLSKIE